MVDEFMSLYLYFLPVMWKYKSFDLPHLVFSVSSLVLLYLGSSVGDVSPHNSHSFRVLLNPFSLLLIFQLP